MSILGKMMGEYVRRNTERTDTKEEKSNALPCSCSFQALKMKWETISRSYTLTLLCAAHWVLATVRAKPAGRTSLTSAEGGEKGRAACAPLLAHCVRAVWTRPFRRLLRPKAPPGRGFVCSSLVPALSCGVHFLALPTLSQTNERTPPASRAAGPGA